MDNLDPLQQEVDFSEAKYTAIVSDLHLCEAEATNQKFPLWKKYKTREFFFDDQFQVFLEYIDTHAGDEKIELILNGDTFDFDSMLYRPENPTYSLSWMERARGMEPEEEKSKDKIRVILEDHEVWCESLKWFIGKGHRLIFVIGNHDLELHWKSVQKEILDFLDLSAGERQRVRFVEWFYISNKDTLIEHGNQYDAYCICDDPINPFVVEYNRLQVRLPFGDWCCRYLVNGMGFFNPHSDESYVMSIGEYVKYFFKYMIWAQPMIVWTWFWSSVAIFWRTIYSNLQRPLTNPLTAEERVESIAGRSNGTPRMVRELRELFVVPAASSPIRILKELYLDRALLILISLFLLLQVFVWVKQIFAISFFWMFIPILGLLPPFLFYSRSIDSYISFYKKPQESILSATGLIANVSRVIYGHTHEVRHEIIGGIEHLNSGTWSPAFLDLECTQKEETNTFLWITPNGSRRKAKVLQVRGDQVLKFW